MNFNDLKVGDIVLVESYSGFDGYQIYAGSVIGRTGTRVTVKVRDVEVKFTTKDGMQYPRSKGYTDGSSLVLPTEVNMAKYYSQKSIRKIKACLYRIGKAEATYKELFSLAELQEFAEVLDKFDKLIESKVNK